MRISILGSGNEIGRSAILVKADKNIVLDYGAKLHGELPEYPIQGDKIDAGVISHAHLDHSGASPLIHRNGSKIFMTDATATLSKLLLLDSIKVAEKEGFGAPFSRSDARKMISKANLRNYGERFNAGNFSCSFYDSGHIPGSAGIFIKSNRSIFYTGDIQTEDSRLLKGCRLPERCDVLITESTYSYKEHPPREKEEKRLTDAVEEALSGDEIALFPVLAVGRTQEILLILEKYAKKIALDGMAKKATDIISRYPKYLKDHKRLYSILKKIKWVETANDRMKVIKSRPIIIASAGMLGGGHAVGYLESIRSRPESKVLFTSFLVEESPGRRLMNTGVFKNDDREFKVECELQQFELSSHTDRKGILSIIKKTNPETVICVHGDKCKEFAGELEKEFPSVQAIAPENGDEIKV